jgi:ABC-type multidrug transport system fused ATPase/permease subunit
MKILQLFNREETESEKFKEINDKHKKHGSKQLYNSIFFPIADIISSLTLGFIIFYGGIKILNGDNFTTFEIYFPIQCL